MSNFKSTVTKEANRRIRASQRRMDFPTWWLKFAYLAGALLAVGLVIALMSGLGDKGPAYVAPLVGNGAPVTSAPPLDPAPSDPNPNETEVPLPSTNPSITPGEAVVSLVDTTGVNVDVPAAAADMAARAASALFTTYMGDVTIYPGDPVPAADTVWSNPVISEPVLYSINETTASFNFTVDPDGNGEATARDVAVNVEKIPSGWAWKTQ